MIGGDRCLPMIQFSAQRITTITLTGGDPTLDRLRNPGCQFGCLACLSGRERRASVISDRLPNRGFEINPERKCILFRHRQPRLGGMHATAAFAWQFQTLSEGNATDGFAGAASARSTLTAFHLYVRIGDGLSLENGSLGGSPIGVEHGTGRRVVASDSNYLSNRELTALWWRCS